MDDYSLDWDDYSYDFSEELDEDIYDLLESFNDYDDYVE